ncbi:LLM class flavin-dependent oxidoreductase [Burkholderia cenocepacia]|nr:LLM class flavin-dependent oxidoreductase [Burkholderia cenocepacia]MDR5670906.1 LLM class flavin-dependent oxidoreductase [Burkholderia cenocepacia]
MIHKGFVSSAVNDPLLLVPAMAQVTRHLGFGVTANLTYEPPYLFARRMSTLDHLTKGRVGWNIVTGYLDSAARGMGLAQQIGHDDRYERADDYMDVVYKLWEQSWDDDAVIRDAQARVFAQPGKVRRVKHDGPFYSVDARGMGLAQQIGHDDRYERADDYMDVVYKLWEQSWDDDAVIRDAQARVFAQPGKVRRVKHDGPFYSVDAIHLSEPSLQRTPVLYQAGSSARGVEFAGRHAECVFVNGQSKAAARAAALDIRAALAAVADYYTKMASHDLFIVQVVAKAIDTLFRDDPHFQLILSRQLGDDGAHAVIGRERVTALTGRDPLPEVDRLVAAHWARIGDIAVRDVAGFLAFEWHCEAVDPAQDGAYRRQRDARARREPDPAGRGMASRADRPVVVRHAARACARRARRADRSRDRGRRGNPGAARRLSA